MGAELTKVFNDRILVETKGIRITPVGVNVTFIVFAHDTVTAEVVVLEGSPLATVPDDAEEWETLLTETLTGDGTFHQTLVGAYHYLRARISTAIVGGTVDVWILTAPPGFGLITERDLSSKIVV